MRRLRRGSIAIIGTLGVAVILFWMLLPDRFHAVSGEAQDLLEVVPEPVLLAVVVLVAVALWIGVMILVARLLYWSWRQIDSYVLKLWDLVLPESPLVRFAAGLMLMIVFFVLGPLVVIQAIDFSRDEDPIQPSDDDPEPTHNDTNASDDGLNETGAQAEGERESLWVDTPEASAMTSVLVRPSLGG